MFLRKHTYKQFMVLTFQSPANCMKHAVVVATAVKARNSKAVPLLL